jgi:catechol 2,3-dioxygenase-like lactoylglutathione lyase family enzyme
MFNHVFLGTNDIDKSRKFYDATMSKLGYEGHPLPHGTVYGSPEGSLIVAKPLNGMEATVSNGHTLGFKAADYSTVDLWHEAGLAAGGTAIEDPPGPRNATGGRVLYLAYLRDPGGNKICALNRIK